MKKLIVSILLVVLIAGALYAYYRWFYVENPRDAFLRTVSAAMLGDEDGFLNGFTDDSRPMVAGLLALSRSDDVRSSTRHPYHFLVTEDVVSVSPEGPDRVWMKLRRMGDGSGSKYDVPLAKTGNTWKIDALAFTGKEHAIAGGH
jgi:hypothetical protein